MAQHIKVGITHGDINGIGYEVILKTLNDERMPELCTPVLFGSSKLVGYYKRVLGNVEEVNFLPVPSADQARDGHSNIVNISSEEFKVDMGIPTPDSGRAALMALDAAVEALRNGEIDVLVTAPISKEAMKMVGFPYAGHTEYLQAKLGGNATMILFDDNMRVALATTHLPLRDIAGAITQPRVEATIDSFNASLKRDFGFERPKIAVLSLNPHSGDNGVLGTEENEIITPAIESRSADGILAFGPFAADGFFGNNTRYAFDGIIAMYHDQGLAPFKALAGTKGVNFTAGLPFVRTSPDHGTGYDIAGKNQADPTSMREAIYAAIDIFRHRTTYDEASRNPLRRQYVERGADKTIDLTKDDDTL